MWTGDCTRPTRKFAVNYHEDTGTVDATSWPETPAPELVAETAFYSLGAIICNKKQRKTWTNHLGQTSECHWLGGKRRNWANYGR